MNGPADRVERIEIDCVVVGAGVVGLAVARAMAGRGFGVAILEAEAAIGMHTSSRNSEVVHAGLYYPTHSAKARHCVDGRRALYDYCDRRGVAYARIGKIIVASTEAQMADLEMLHARGQANGVEGLSLIDAARVAQLEPNVRAVGAILSEDTGIVDSHGLMVAMQHDAEMSGAYLSFEAIVEGVAHRAGRYEIAVGGQERFDISARFLVNAAGHGAPALARSMEALDPAHVPVPRFAKGTYAAYSGRSPFRRLVYPAPVPGGLGIHATLDLGGAVRFGPNVEWVDDYDVHPDPAVLDEFYEAIRRYWPGLPDDSLTVDYCGVRPKIVGPGEAAGDFIVSTEADHGLPGLVNLFGIESPGLTSSLSIADAVRDALLDTRHMQIAS
ncbi:MAG: NAD(P)/FAD-dependent oxidoreductase [Litorimonas sp.]